MNLNWNDAVYSQLLGRSGNAYTVDKYGVLEEEHCQESDIVSLGNAMDSCLQPVDLFNELSVEDIECISIVPAEGNKPASLFHEPLIEAKSFPSLFPNGDHTYDAERDDSISRCDYYKARIFSADPRFAANTSYIFVAQYAYECKKLLLSISINLRKGSGASKINSFLTCPRIPQVLKKNHVEIGRASCRERV